jgi:hypothetical protein
MTHGLTWLMVPATAVIWRLGGGALTTLTGFSLGTDFARALRALPALVLCVAFGWWGLLGVPALFLGVCIGGWGPFQGMGLPGLAVEASWQQWLPRALRLKPGTVGFDLVGMMESGTLCMAPLAVLVAFLTLWPTALILLVAGLEFALAYLCARIIPWSIPRFATGQEWGEVFTGVMIGAALVNVVYFSAGWSF